MKKIACLIAVAVLAAAPARAEPAQFTVKELREIKIGLNALMNGKESKIRDGDHDRALREDYHFATPALDAVAAKNFVRIDAALAQTEKELTAAARRICPTPDACAIGEKDDAATREKKLGAIKQVNEEQEKAAAETLRVDLIRVSEDDLDKVTPRIPIAIRTVLEPLTRQAEKAN